MREFLRKLIWLAQRRRKEAELREELQFHLDAEAEERCAPTVTDREARQAALRDLANYTRVQEETRAAWGWTRLEQLAQDLRYAVRTMQSNRLFTAMAIVSLALGIGANTAIYSFVDAILLRALPVPEADRLMVMKWRAPVFPRLVHSFSMASGTMYTEGKSGTLAAIFPYPALELFQRDTAILSSAFCYYGADNLSVTVRQETEALNGQYVSGDYFRGMEIPPATGRLLTADDDRPGAAPATVLSYRYSRTKFGGPANAVGQSIRINDQPFTVVGVAPPDFFGADPAAVPSLWVPLHTNLLLEPPSSQKALAARYLDRNFYWLQVMGRLRPGVRPEQAQAVFAPQFRQFAESSASTAEERGNLPQLALFSGETGLDSLRHTYSRPLYVLMAMAGLTLLIACANISNLLLARSMARRREIAVRLSMGAGRLRVIRQLLTESVLLAAVGGALGIAVAIGGIRFLTLLLAAGRGDFTLRAELNWHVLAVTLALSLLTGLLFGLAPALAATRTDLMPALKGLARTGRHSALRLKPGQFLVGVQIAVSLMLLMAAGLFGRTLSNLHSIDLGFNQENTLLFTVKPRALGYDVAARKRLFTDLRERLSTIPGVRGVSFSPDPLLSGWGSMVKEVAVSGAASPSEPMRAGIFDVGPDFFRTMQIPLLAGREFDARDDSGPAAVVVNRRFAGLYGLTNPVGRTATMPVGRTATMNAHRYLIVGLVGDASFLSLKEPRPPMLYFPSTSPGEATFEMRAAGNPLEQVRTVRQIVRQMDPRLAISGVDTQTAHDDRAINQEIALARLCTAFALLAVTIAGVGLYGTVAFHVTRRTSEIGIRMALGAQRPGILWLVLREVLLLSVAGLALGTAGALAGSQYVASFLYGIKPRDPVALGAAVAILLATALLAGYMPARRASRIDPMAALRHE